MFNTVALSHRASLMGTKVFVVRLPQTRGSGKDQPCCSFGERHCTRQMAILYWPMARWLIKTLALSRVAFASSGALRRD